MCCRLQEEHTLPTSSINDHLSVLSNVRRTKGPRFGDAAAASAAGSRCFRCRFNYRRIGMIFSTCQQDSKLAFACSRCTAAQRTAAQRQKEGRLGGRFYESDEMRRNGKLVTFHSFASIHEFEVQLDSPSEIYHASQCRSARARGRRLASHQELCPRSITKVDAADLIDTDSLYEWLRSLRSADTLKEDIKSA
jgi:hypothetical protein